MLNVIDVNSDIKFKIGLAKTNVTFQSFDVILFIDIKEMFDQKTISDTNRIN